MEMESRQALRKYTTEYKLKLVMEMLKCDRSIAAVAKERTEKCMDITIRKLKF